MFVIIEGYIWERQVVVQGKVSIIPISCAVVFKAYNMIWVLYKYKIKLKIKDKK